MNWLEWKTFEIKCLHCGEEATDKVPTQFEDEKLGLQALEYPINCVKCSRTRFYAVRKKIKAFVSPEDYEKIPKFEIKRRCKKNKW